MHFKVLETRAKSLMPWVNKVNNEIAHRKPTSFGDLLTAAVTLFNSKVMLSELLGFSLVLRMRTKRWEKARGKARGKTTVMLKKKTALMTKMTVGAKEMMNTWATTLTWRVITLKKGKHHIYLVIEALQTRGTEKEKEMDTKRGRTTVANEKGR